MWKCRLWWLCAWVVAVLPSVGCQMVKPTNDRNWSPDQAVLAYAEIEGDQATVYNVRNCSYSATDIYQLQHYDKTYDLNKVKTVDFVVVPFTGMPELAHTFLSFGLEGGEYVGISVEIRKQAGDEYNPVKSMFNEYEIMYVIGDERDLIGLRSNYRLDDVYIYRGNASPEVARAIFVDMLERANKLAKEPEYYNLITNNCTTNVAKHVNRIAPTPIPYDYRILLPGLSDRMAYERGLIVGEETFELTKRAARANVLAYQYRDSPEFSQKIRLR